MSNPILDFGQVLIRIDLDNKKIQLSSDGGRTWVDSTAQASIGDGSVTNDQLAGDIALSKLAAGGMSVGDMIMLGAAGWERLAAGAAGQVLTGQGAEVAPQWASVPIARQGARVGNSLTTSVPSGTGTYVAYDTVRWDSGGFFDPGAPDRLTVPAGLGGLYLIGSAISFTAETSTSGSRSLQVHPGTVLKFLAVDTRAPAPVGKNTALAVASIWPLAAGDYVRCRVFQDSGSAITLANNEYYGQDLWLIRLGD